MFHSCTCDRGDHQGPQKAGSTIRQTLFTKEKIPGQKGGPRPPRPTPKSAPEDSLIFIFIVIIAARQLENQSGNGAGQQLAWRFKK